VVVLPSVECESKLVTGLVSRRGDHRRGEIIITLVLPSVEVFCVGFLMLFLLDKDVGEIHREE